MKKNFIVPLLALFWVVTICFAACERPSNRPYRNPYGNGGAANLPEKHFESSLEAYNFGKTYFEETATFYESSSQGTASPQGLGGMAGPQSNYTRRYLSANGDFLYDTANYSAKKALGVDTNFSFLAAIKSGETNVRYKKFNGDNLITMSGSEFYSDYSAYNLSSLESVTAAQFEQTCGLNPRGLVNYVINASTVSKDHGLVKNGKIGDTEYAYTFKLELNEGAHQSYRTQVNYNSGQKYKDFISLTVEFGTDKYGRVVCVSVNEEYSIELLSTRTKVQNVQYLSYTKPQLNFDGFTASRDEG